MRNLAKQWQKLSFLIIVVFPTLVAAIYFYGFASDQYVSEFKFNLRKVSDPWSASSPAAAGGGGSGMGAAATSGAAASQIWDSQTIVQLIRSRDVVDELNSSLGFDKVYARSDVDWIARAAARAPAEKRTDYWRWMVDAYFETTTGVVTVTVRAFSPQDADHVATKVLEIAERAVNQLTIRSRDDSLRFAEAEVARTEEDLKKSQLAVRTFRNVSDVIDPAKSAEADQIYVARLRERATEMRGRYEVLRRRTPESAMLPLLATQIDVLDRQIEAEQARLTKSSRQPGADAGSADNMPVTSLLTDYQALVLDEAFHEKAYLFALQSLQQARAEVAKQQIYLNAFVKPALPEEPLYPRKIRSILAIFVVGVALWGLLSLAYYSVRDHV